VIDSRVGEVDPELSDKGADVSLHSTLLPPAKKGVLYICGEQGREMKSKTRRVLGKGG
jgi:hypothetical protein